VDLKTAESVAECRRQINLIYKEVTNEEVFLHLHDKNSRSEIIQLKIIMLCENKEFNY
jgi:hypothetical protein